MNLTRLLKELREESLKKMPPDVAEIMLNDTKEQIKNGVANHALRIGQQMPDFKLKNAVGDTVDSKDLLENGPLILSFYRGAWCPYCNLELSAYQEALPEIQALGAQLVAISPELPDASLSLVEKHTLKYEILSDIDNAIAKEFGIVFKLQDNLLALYEKFGIDLKSRHGNANYELPIPATYVINSDGTILEAAVNYNYTDRLDPKDAIAVIKKSAY